MTQKLQTFKKHKVTRVLPPWLSVIPLPHNKFPHNLV